MASSKDRAISLKNNYVAGLIEAGATAPMPTMPEQDMGNRATAIHDAATGTTTYVNDNRPNEVYADSDRGIQQVTHQPWAANPMTGIEGLWKKYEQVPSHAGTRREAKAAVDEIIKYGDVPGQGRLSDYHRELINRGAR